MVRARSLLLPDRPVEALLIPWRPMTILAPGGAAVQALHGRAARFSPPRRGVNDGDLRIRREARSVRPSSKEGFQNGAH